MTFKYKKKIFKNFNKVSLITNSQFKDNRGIIYSLQSQSLVKKEIKKKFSNFQDKLMIRKKNSLTGIHGDNKTWKILSCLKGKILVVLVNCDKKDKNFGKHIKLTLSDSDRKVLVIPPKIGNSYLCLNDDNFIFYKVLFNGKYFDVENQFTYKWNDKSFKIDWPTKKPILSARDR